MDKSEITFREKIKDFYFAYVFLLKNKRKDTIVYTLCTILSGVASLIFDVFFIAKVLELLISGVSWDKILFVCIEGVVLVLLRVILSKIASQLEARIYTVNKACMNIEIYKKSLDYSLKEYHNPEFFDSYKLVIDSGVDNINKALNIMTQIIQSLILCGVFLFEVIRQNTIIVSIITVALIIHVSIWTVILKKQSDIQYDNQKKIQQCKRICEYYERQFYLRESAIELKNKVLFDCISSKFTSSLLNLMNTEKLTRKRSFIVELLNPIVTNTYQSLVELMVIFVMFNMGIKDVSVYWKLIALFTKMSSLYLFRCIGDITTISKYVRLLKEFFKYPTKDKNSINFIQEAPILKIQNVCFSYKQNDPFRLKNINICVSSGESIAIVGRNGSGKTTLMNLLLNVYEPDAGHISVATEDGYEIELSNFCPNMITQEYNTYYTTIRNNITMGGLDFSDEDILEAANKAKCDFLDNIEQPLDTLIGKELYNDAIELSGGQSQRIALARCFLSRSSLIVLDEPTAAIDPIFEKPLIEHLLDIISKKTAVIITHRLDITQFVDRIYVMEDGEIIESGSFKELMSRRSIFKDMYKTQKGIVI